ncbi:MAG: nitroreductase family protein [Coriobacteriales bacterium]|jgi:hypothetical protein|nr:nitroreductase family protein [Coriobacteriales bacterium]
MSHQLPFDEIYNNLFDVISHRRSHRQYPGTSFPLQLGYDPQPPKPAEPLSKAELALLCYAAAGYNGLIMNELMAIPAVSYLQGRTISSGDNSQKSQIVFTNDDGVFLYKPRPTTKMVRISCPEELQEVVNAFDNEVIQLEGTKRELEMGLMGGELEKPKGQTIFFPLIQPSDSLYKFAAISVVEGLGYYFTDDDGNPIGDTSFIEKLNLTKKMPISEMGKQTHQWNVLEAGFITQNLLLAAESMGLAACPFAGFAEPVILGGTPLTRGLRARFTTDKNGALNPVGIDGVCEAPVPPYIDVRDAVEASIRARFAEGGAYNKNTPSALTPENHVKFVEGTVQYTEDMIQYMRGVMGWVYDQNGRLPASAPSLSVPIGIYIAHVDVEFYEKYYRPGAINERHINHNALWHS